MMIASPPIQVPPARRSSLLTAAFVLVILAFLLLLVGFIAPGWDVYTSEAFGFQTGSYHIGLWFALACFYGSCVSGSFGILDTVTAFIGFDVWSYRVESLFAIAFSIAGLILTVKVRRQATLPGIYGSNKGIKIAAIITCGISGILALVAAGTNGDRVRKIDTIIDLVFKSSFPYATCVFGVGGLFIVLAAVLIAINLCKSRDHDNRNGINGNQSQMMNAVGQQQQPYIVASGYPQYGSPQQYPATQQYPPTHSYPQTQNTNRAYDAYEYDRQSSSERYLEDERMARGHNSY